jgi:hypothetical protein
MESGYFHVFPAFYKLLLKTGPRWCWKLVLHVTSSPTVPRRNVDNRSLDQIWPVIQHGHYHFPCRVKATVPSDVTRERINTADLVPVVSQWRRSEPQNMLEVGQRRVDGDLESVELLVYYVQAYWHSIADRAMLYTTLLTWHCRHNPTDITPWMEYYLTDCYRARTRTRMYCGMSDESQNCEASSQPLLVNGSVSVMRLPQQTSMKQ